MTKLQKQNIDSMQELGISMRHLTYDEAVDVLIHKYVEATTACDFIEEERFQKDLERVTKKPSN